jgi:hypothetical protein
MTIQLVTRIRPCDDRFLFCVSCYVILCCNFNDTVFSGHLGRLLVDPLRLNQFQVRYS